MDDATKQTFPEFKPQSPMFEGTTETQSPPATPTIPTNGETGKPKRKYTRRAPASPSPAKTSRRGKPRGARRTMPATVLQPGPVAQVAAVVERGEQRRRGRKAKQPRPLMVPIGLLPELGGMKTEDASLLMSLIGNLQTTNKRSRTRIVAALGKLFG